MKTTLDETLKISDSLVQATAGDAVPCDHFLDAAKKTSCLTILHGKFPNGSDSKIHYGTPQVAPKVIASLCAGCRAHYYAQMTRNALFDHKRSR